MSWSFCAFESLYAVPSRNGIYKSSEHHGAGAKIVNMGELFAHEFVGPQEMSRLTMSEAELEKAGLVDGDLLFGRRSLVESGAGKCSVVEWLVGPTTFESSLIRVRLDLEKALPRFYYYWFLSRLGRGSIRAIVSGTNVKGIRGSELKNVLVPIIDLDEQRRISDVLSAYDDLIENNRRRILLLEESARLLYSEWFVHLRFPGHERVKVVDGVPEGWERKYLAEICDEIRLAVKPEKIVAGTPYIGLEHLPRRSITLRDWAYSDDLASQKFAYEEGDILFGKIRPYFHKVGFSMNCGVTSSDTIVIRSKVKALYFYLLMLVSSDQFVAIASKTVKEGSKMPRADWKYLKRQLVIVPPDHFLADFNEPCTAIIGQLKVLARQEKALREARDLLLPRLMSGEIQV